jgi:hypothetical protein
VHLVGPYYANTTNFAIGLGVSFLRMVHSVVVGTVLLVYLSLLAVFCWLL